ncbi:Tfp pilus assembly protein FimT/FimU [Effusibacillus consociatus]|uniref:Tfp pilus assembly protein FimT/FimU n=2 Tax=Effusibacillus consociatus TaxID=1117041 RepID=A0ABV9Q910_9BACL
MMKQLSPARNTLQALRPSESGFSLVELLIVLFCLAALLGLSLPGYQRVIDNKNLQGTANQLYADMKECQSMALLTGENHSLRLNKDDGYEVWTGTAKRKSITFPKGIRISEQKWASNRPVLQFNGKGHPVGGGTVVLRNRHNKEISLTVHLHTGQIQVKEGRE